MIEALLINLGLIVGMMTLVWLASLPLRDVSIVDIFWGLGFVVVAAGMLGQVEPWSWPRLVLLGMTAGWGIRLSAYLGWRNWGKPEDFRYQSLRDKVGPAFPLLSMLYVFGLQAVLAWIVSLPVQAGIYGGELSSPVIAGVGVAVWLTGLLFEAVGDFQLARFKGNPENAGKVLDRGLWRYTRHPNYFGDFLVWWGLTLFSLALGAPWWALVGPVLMSWLLMRFSGVPMLESALSERKPGYAEYVRRTSAFFPRPPQSV